MTIFDTVLQYAETEKDKCDLLQDISICSTGTLPNTWAKGLPVLYIQLQQKLIKTVFNTCRSHNYLLDLSLYNNFLLDLCLYNGIV